jgi:hypothetical protein
LVLHITFTKSQKFSRKKVILPTHGTCATICGVTKERWFLRDRVRLKSYPPQLHQNRLSQKDLKSVVKEGQNTLDLIALKQEKLSNGNNEA